MAALMLQLAAKVAVFNLLVPKKHFGYIKSYAAGTGERYPPNGWKW